MLFFSCGTPSSASVVCAVSDDSVGSNKSEKQNVPFQRSLTYTHDAENLLDAKHCWKASTAWSACSGLYLDETGCLPAVKKKDSHGSLEANGIARATVFLSRLFVFFYCVNHLI